MILVSADLGRLYCFGDNIAFQCGLGVNALMCSLTFLPLTNKILCSQDNKDQQIIQPQRVSEVDDEVVAFIGAKDTLSVAVTGNIDSSVIQFLSSFPCFRMCVVSGWLNLYDLSFFSCRSRSNLRVGKWSR